MIIAKGENKKFKKSLVLAAKAIKFASQKA